MSRLHLAALQPYLAAVSRGAPEVGAVNADSHNPIPIHHPSSHTGHPITGVGNQNPEVSNLSASTSVAEILIPMGGMISSTGTSAGRTGFP